MNKGLYIKKQNNHILYKKRLYKWRDLCDKYKKDEEVELRKIYKTLTDCEEEPVLKKNRFGYGSEDTVYIYEIAGRLYYGKDQKEYPIFDDSLWPWNVGQVPFLYKDIYLALIKHMTPKEVIRFGGVNKMAYEVSKNPTYWAKYKEWMNQNVICTRGYKNIRDVYVILGKTLTEKITVKSHISLLLNLLFPFGDRVSGDSHFITLDLKHIIGFTYDRRGKYGKFRVGNITDSKNINMLRVFRYMLDKHLDGNYEKAHCGGYYINWCKTLF